MASSKFFAAMALLPNVLSSSADAIVYAGLDEQAIPTSSVKPTRPSVREKLVFY